MDPPFPMMDPPMPVPDDPRAESPDAESYDDEPAEDYDDASSSAAANNPALTGATEDDEGEPTVYSSVRSLQCLSHLRDISDSAVAWQVSSAKPGNGVEQLRDPGTDTYWQSDGTTQPHYIQIHFHRRVAVTHVALYLDYQLDESYTPKTVQLETGMTSQDLICASAQNQCMELHEPSGWVILPVYSSLEHSSAHTAAQQQQQPQMHSTSKAHLLRISILSMAQNGRDTHVRRVAIFAERSNTTTTVPSSLLPAKRKTRKSVQHRTSSNSEDQHAFEEDEQEEEEEDDDDDLSLLTRGLGFSTLGMPTTTFATTIR